MEIAALVLDDEAVVGLQVAMLDSVIIEVMHPLQIHRVSEKGRDKAGRKMRVNDKDMT